LCVIDTYVFLQSQSHYRYQNTNTECVQNLRNTDQSVYCIREVKKYFSDEGTSTIYQISSERRARIALSLQRRSASWTVGVRFRAGERDFSLLHSIQTGPGPELLRPTQPPIQCLSGVLSPGLKGVKLITQLLLVPRSRIVEVFLHFPYASMAWCLINIQNIPLPYLYLYSYLRCKKPLYAERREPILPRRSGEKKCNTIL
jgi:hypothetical protein